MFLQSSNPDDSSHQGPPAPIRLISYEQTAKRPLPNGNAQTHTIQARKVRQPRYDVRKHLVLPLRTTAAARTA